MTDEIRDDEIIVDAKTGKLDGMKTTITRYYTMSARTGLIVILTVSIAAWAGVFFLGFGFGGLTCGD